VTDESADSTGEQQPHDDLLANLRASVQRLSGLSRAMSERAAGEAPTVTWRPATGDSARAEDGQENSDETVESDGRALTDAGAHLSSETHLFGSAPVELEPRAQERPIAEQNEYAEPGSWLFGQSSTSDAGKREADAGVYWHEDVFPTAGAALASEVAPSASPEEAHMAAGRQVEEEREEEDGAPEPETSTVPNESSIPREFLAPFQVRPKLFDGDPYDEYGRAVTAELPSVEPGPARSGLTEHRSAPPAAAIAERMPHLRPEGAPDQVQVVAYPFQNFAVVNSFINALRRIPNVHNVAPRHFRGGTIQLAVDYTGREMLSEHIRELTHFDPEIVTEDGSSVTVAIGAKV
jgi:hypothetical protein